MHIIPKQYSEGNTNLYHISIKNMENALCWINVFFISASPEVTKIKWRFILTQLESTTFYRDIVEKISVLKDHLNLNIKHFSQLW